MMANEKTYTRTIKKLCLVNVYCSIIIIVILHLSLVLGIETKSELTQNVTSTLEANNKTSQQPIAEPLIRFRRQPPRTIVKHIVRPKRFKMKRVKRPKIKYTFAEPPHPRPAYFNRKPTSVKKPTFETSIYEDFSHMNVESADFDLPPSSYEAQSMDLDLYKHYEPSVETTYKEIQKPPEYSYTAPEISFKEHSYTEVRNTPTYTYTEPEIKYKETTKPTVTYTYAPAKTRKPHTKYGIPTEYTYTTGYDKPNDNKYTFEAPASKPVYKEAGKPFYNAHGKNEYSYSKPAKEIPRIPATTYGVPDVHIPVTGSNDYNKYSVIEQKPPYASYTPNKIETYHFAEPPQPEPSVEITYSPSYEINIPSPDENSYSGGKYNVQHQPPPQHDPSYDDHQPSYQDHPTYEEPSQEYHPPTNHHVYEGAPQKNYEPTGPSYQEGSDTNQPASYQPAPPRHESLGIPHSQNLPIDVNHKQPPYDYPKSSYEVPIYDPIPFDSSNNEEREIYPPQTLDHINRQQAPTKKDFQGQSSNLSEQRPAPEEATSDNRPQTMVPNHQSPINRLRRRKRKRTKGSSTTVSTTKHILDVPELEEAFEKENRKKYPNTQEPEPDESHRIENINNHNSNNINNNYNNGPWNPMKIRTSPIMATTPSTTSAINSSSLKNRRYHYKPQRTSSTTTTTTEAAPPAKVEIISIEKSRSKTYYDGVVSTPKIFNTNFLRNRYRTERTSTTEQPQKKSTNENKLTKRTTKNVFDTTIFKSPLNDRDVYRNLPKNHKLF